MFTARWSSARKLTDGRTRLLLVERARGNCASRCRRWRDDDVRGAMDEARRPTLIISTRRRRHSLTAQRKLLLLLSLAYCNERPSDGQTDRRTDSGTVLPSNNERLPQQLGGRTGRRAAAADRSINSSSSSSCAPCSHRITCVRKHRTAQHQLCNHDGVSPPPQPPTVSWSSRIPSVPTHRWQSPIKRLD